MRIKSFVAKSVDDAIAQARAELGEDALLLNTRKVNESGQPGGYEVVFGLAEMELPEPVPEEAPAPEETHAAQDDVAGELGRLHARMDEIRTLIERSSKNRLMGGRAVPELEDVYGRLLAADVDPLLSQEIVDRLEASMANDESFQPSAKNHQVDFDRLELLIRAELERRVIVDAQLGGGGGNGTVVILVGPAGAGKTTSLMKLAASDRLAGCPVRLLSLDTSRVAPQMQLQYFAAHLGIPFASVPSIDGLPAMIEEARKKELVLIDTPGYAGNEDRGIEAAAGVLASCPEVDVHLVVPGYMKAGDLRRAIRRYEPFRPSKILVTKLDETQTFGSIYSGAAWAGLKLSFLTQGRAIPDDIRPASLQDFIAMVIDRQKALAQSVA